MVKLTKKQQKKLANDIMSKTKKLYFAQMGVTYQDIVTVADISAVEKLTKKWLKRIG